MSWQETMQLASLFQMEIDMKKDFVKTADGSVWEVEKEFSKYYLIRSKFKIKIDKRHIVARFQKEVKQYE